MKTLFLLTLKPAVAVAAMAAAIFLQGCKDTPPPPPPPAPTKAKIEALVAKTRKDLIFVKGGEFQMGYFLERHPDSGELSSDHVDELPLHKVTLAHFSIGKYKVTLGEYDLYAAANGKPLPFTLPEPLDADYQYRGHPKSSAFPAGAGWNDAQGYCRWIGKLAGAAMDLPTEAEWEYAARARGTLLVDATNNGETEPGKNYRRPTKPMADDGDFFDDFSVGQFPPNPLGLHDLASHGYEWTSDWYAADYYSRSPENNPRGPQSGTEKVIRGVPLNHSFPAMTVERAGRRPELVDGPEIESNLGYGFRCVARPSPLSKGAQ